jgi:hypothetical protein
MAELKTSPTGESLEAFLDTIGDEGRRREAFTFLELMHKTRQSEQRMWEPNIVWFGDTHL